MTSSRIPTVGRYADFLPDLRMGLENLRAHKLRSLLTMLGMIFGVAAVVSMLSIGAGAQQQVMAFIEQLGVRNLIVESREATDEQTLQKMRARSRRASPSRTCASIQANLDGVTASTARKRFTPSKLIPKPAGDMPIVYGVAPVLHADRRPARSADGRFFNDADEAARGAGRGARRRRRARRSSAAGRPSANTSRSTSSGCASSASPDRSSAAQTDVGGVPAEDRNNIIYVPLGTAILRLEDAQSNAARTRSTASTCSSRRRERQRGDGGRGSRPC